MIRTIDRGVVRDLHSSTFVQSSAGNVDKRSRHMRVASRRTRARKSQTDNVKRVQQFVRCVCVHLHRSMRLRVCAQTLEFDGYTALAGDASAETARRQTQTVRRMRGPR